MAQSSSGSRQSITTWRETDIRDRETFGEGHEKGAVNIPFEEVLLRGPAELRQTDAEIVGVYGVRQAGCGTSRSL
jgi:hypothetical protein